MRTEHAPPATRAESRTSAAAGHAVQRQGRAQSSQRSGGRASRRRQQGGTTERATSASASVAMQAAAAPRERPQEEMTQPQRRSRVENARRAGHAAQSQGRAPPPQRSGGRASRRRQHGGTTERATSASASAVPQAAAPRERPSEDTTQLRRRSRAESARRRPHCAEPRASAAAAEERRPSVTPPPVRWHDQAGNERDRERGAAGSGAARATARGHDVTATTATRRERAPPATPRRAKVERRRRRGSEGKRYAAASAAARPPTMPSTPRAPSGRAVVRRMSSPCSASGAFLASLSVPSQLLFEAAPPQARAAPQSAPPCTRSERAPRRDARQRRGAHERGGKEREVTRQSPCLTNIAITRGSARRRERERERERKLAPRSVRRSRAERGAAAWPHPPARSADQERPESPKSPNSREDDATTQQRSMRAQHGASTGTARNAAPRDDRQEKRSVAAWSNQHPLAQSADRSTDRYEPRDRNNAAERAPAGASAEPAPPLLGVRAPLAGEDGGVGSSCSWSNGMRSAQHSRQGIDQRRDFRLFVIAKRTTKKTTATWAGRRGRRRGARKATATAKTKTKMKTTGTLAKRRTKTKTSTTTRRTACGCLGAGKKIRTVACTTPRLPPNVRAAVVAALSATRQVGVKGRFPGTKDQPKGVRPGS